MDQQVIRETITYSARNITDTDRALGAEFNELALEAMYRARRYMRYGPHDARVAVVTAMLRATAKTAAVDAKAEIEVARTALLDAFSQMTLPSPDGEPTPVALPVSAFDQNDETRDQAVRP